MFYLSIQIFWIWMQTHCCFEQTCFWHGYGNAVVTFEITKLKRALMWSASECLSNLKNIGMKRLPEVPAGLANQWAIITLYFVTLPYGPCERRKIKSLPLLSFRFCWADFLIFFYIHCCAVMKLNVAGSPRFLLILCDRCIVK